MTVSQLIKKLKNMPPGAQVGVSHGDNCEYEVAGWVSHVCCHNKVDYQSDVDKLSNVGDKEAYAGHPRVWVTLHC